MHSAHSHRHTHTQMCLGTVDMLCVHSDPHGARGGCGVGGGGRQQKGWVLDAILSGRISSRNGIAARAGVIIYDDRDARRAGCWLRESSLYTFIMLLGGGGEQQGRVTLFFSFFCIKKKHIYVPIQSR